jgi:recombination protein RecT
MPDNSIQKKLTERQQQQNSQPSNEVEVKDGNSTVSRQSALRQLLKRYEPIIQEALPQGYVAERLVRLAMTQMRYVPRLAQADDMSLLGAVLTSAQLGIEPGPLGEGWILPWKNGKTGKIEARFQLGYKGMAKLFWQHPLAAYLDTQTVYENDEFDYDFGTNAFLHHKPARGDRGTKTGEYYAIAKLTNGGYRFVVLSTDDVNKRHRQRSQTPNSPAWTNDYDAMAEKSCIVELFGLLPKSASLSRAMAADDTVRTNFESDALDSQVPEALVMENEPLEIESGNE